MCSTLNQVRTTTSTVIDPMIFVVVLLLLSLTNFVQAQNPEGTSTGFNYSSAVSQSQGDCYIELRSWGLDDSEWTGYIRVNGQLAINTTTVFSAYSPAVLSVRGVNTVLLQPNSCGWQNASHLDTMSFNGLELLFNYLNDLPNGTVVCGVTADTAMYYNATPVATIQSLLRFGIDVTTLDFREKMTFVATIGHPQLTRYNITTNVGGNLLMNTTVSPQGGALLPNGSCADTNTLDGSGQSATARQCNATGVSNGSHITEDLARLSKIEVTYGTVNYVISLAANLTNEPDILTSNDVVHASIVLSNVANLSQIDNKITEQFFTTVSNLASVDRRTLLAAQSSNRITSAVATLGDNVMLNETHTNVTLVRQNIIFQVVRLTGSVQGFGLAVESLNWKDSSRVHLVNSHIFSSANLSQWESAIFFSEETLRYIQHSFANETDVSYRISSVVYGNDNFFIANSSAPDKSNVISQLVMSSSVSGMELTNLSKPITIAYRLKEGGRNALTKCSYWDYTESAWSTHGMSIGVGWNETDSRSNYTSVICYSRHLTNFAVIAGSMGPNDSPLAKALEYISVIGLSLSIFGLGFVILTIILSRFLEKGNSQLVLLQLAIALLAVDILVLSGIDKTSPVAGCKAVTALLLYFLLVAFSWMCVAAVIQYLKFVKVFNTHTSRFMLKTAIPAWIGPGIIVAVVAIIDGTAKELLLTGRVTYCWLADDAFHFAFLLPLGLIMVVNLVMFVLVVRGITCDRPKDLRSTQTKNAIVKLQVVTAAGCFVIMGLTWLFAFFAIDKAAVPFQILFCIFNSMQGFLIFLFMIVRDKSVRAMWKKLIGRVVRLLPCEVHTARARQPGDGESGNTTNAIPQTNSHSTEMEMKIQSVHNEADGTRESDLDPHDSMNKELPENTSYYHYNDVYVQ